jgi:hypothetical protein
MKFLTNKTLVILLLTLFWSACNEDTEMDYETSPKIQTLTDPALQVNTPVIGFQAGTENYDYSITVNNPENNLQLEEVRVFSEFTDAETGHVSDEVQLTSIPVEGTNRNDIDGTFDYSQLREGITIDGTPLPDDQLLLKVGSGWKLRFEGVTSSGKVIRLKGNINVAVLSRFAGIYKVISSEYYRISVLTATWNGETRFIGSVDENTFSYNDWWGQFAWTGNQFNFDVDFETNKITAPIIVDGLFSGNSALDCATTPEKFAVFNCQNTNVLIPDEVNGKHIIKLTYGYFTDGSGPREFQEVLEKVVD